MRDPIGYPPRRAKKPPGPCIEEPGGCQCLCGVLRAYSTVNCVVAAMGEMVPSAVMARTVNSYSPGSAI